MRRGTPIAEAPLQPFPAEQLMAHPMSTRVNTPKDDDAKVIEPVG